MHKVLFIAYYYPPLGGIGSQRAQKFAYYLPDYGWQPIVLTPEHGSYMLDATLDAGTSRGVQIMRTPTTDISALLKSAWLKRATRGGNDGNGGNDGGQHTPAPATQSEEPGGLTQRLRGLVRTWLYIPDGQIGWLPHAVRRGKRALRSQRIDAIYSTSFPVTAHLVARNLKLATGKPWIADFRDLYSEYHYADYSHPLRKQLDRWLESKLFDQADVLVTVSEAWAATLRRLTHGQKRVEVIRNGFDAAEFAGLDTSAPDRWTVTYVGLFHGRRQDPRPFLEALSHLIEQGQVPREQVQFKIVGQPEPYVQALVEGLGLADVTHFTGFVAHRKALEHQLRSSLLLLIVPNHAANQGHVPGKLYEYLGARRPILALMPPDFEAASLIRNAGAGSAVDQTDAARLERSLFESYRAFAAEQRVELPPTDLTAYERAGQARQLAGLLDDIRERG